MTLDDVNRLGASVLVARLLSKQRARVRDRAQWIAELVRQHCEEPIAPRDGGANFVFSQLPIGYVAPDSEHAYTRTYPRSVVV